MTFFVIEAVPHKEWPVEGPEHIPRSELLVVTPDQYRFCRIVPDSFLEYLSRFPCSHCGSRPFATHALLVA